MASTNIQRTHASAPTDNKKCTISVWVKRGVLNGTNSSSGIYGGINAAWNAAGNVQIGFMNDKAYCWFKTASGDRKKQESTKVFRDTNAWYHIVFRIDTTQSTGSDRIRVYCNNEELTSWGSTADPTLNEDISFTTNGYTNYIGKFNWTNGGVNYFDGLMSHFHFCDGYSYAPSEFGETDSTTGEWKIKTAPSVNYGNNGYFILKDGNSLTDQSSNTNNWSTHNGTLTKTEDCPSNVFATFNPLDNARNYSGTIDLSNGNTTQSNASDASLVSSLGMNSGKWYAEFKIVNTFNTRTFGIIDISENQGYIGHASLAAANSYAYKASAGNLWNGTTEVASSAPGASAGDIIGIAVDLDSSTKTIKWTLNGSDLTGGTTSINITQSDVTWAFFVRADGGQTISANFGNGYFGTTAVASAGTNASNLGIFEYNVPNGYTALSTKGLNE